MQITVTHINGRNPILSAVKQILSPGKRDVSPYKAGTHCGILQANKTVYLDSGWKVTCCCISNAIITGLPK